MSDIPILIGPDGAQPIAPIDLREALVAAATALAPGLTTTLPGSLIEDLASTGTGGLVEIDAARVDLIDSLTPAQANIPLLLAIGEQCGVPKNATTNTSVNVIFSGPPGFLIGRGFVVSDGNHQYTVVDGGVIGSGGSTSSLYALASVAGSWAVPSGSVTQLVTSVPDGIIITVTNPNTGTPGNATEETWESYRARVLQAQKAASQGMPTYLKALVSVVSGVQPRLVAVKQSISPAGWEVIVGGGDPYEVAYAIYTALFDISSLVGSATTARNVTVSINDYPDTYSLIYVTPPQQTVTMVITWNTTSTNLVSNSAVAQLATPALVNYINSIQATQPMNLFVLQRTFQTAIESILPESLLTRMEFVVNIDGVTVDPVSGTGVIAGDNESYLYTDPQGAGIVVNQG